MLAVAPQDPGVFVKNLELSFWAAAAMWCHAMLCPPLHILPFLFPSNNLASHCGIPGKCYCCCWLFATPWTEARQASLFFTISWSLLKLMSIESVMPSNHLILCCPLLLSSIFPSIRVFSSELALCIRWPNYWSFSFSISPSNAYSGLISLRID